MRRATTWTLLLACWIGGCDTADPKSAGRPPAVAPGVEKYGAPLKPGDVVPISKVLADPGAFASKEVTVEAKVRRACRRKGCWMELAQGDEDGNQGCRVTFKDYGFFVPLDSAGASARVQGVVKTKKIAAGEVAHLEQEGARFARKDPDGSAREVRIVATGVELER